MTEKLYYSTSGWYGDAKVEHTRLHHQMFDTEDKFFQRVEQYGGWPMDKLYVGFAHSDERECTFTDTEIRHGWHTSIYHRDTYLWWKMTPAKKAEIRKGHRKEFADAIRSMT